MKNIKINVNYIDNLTVEKKKRKQVIAHKMNQTQHYHIRKLNLTNKICLFKREIELTAIIPVTDKKTIFYNIGDLILNKTKIKINVFYNLIKIDKTNFLFFKEKLKDAVCKFTLQINLELTTLFNLILNNKIIIYCTVYKDEIYSYYFYRNTPSLIESKKCVELICSINNSIYKDDFYYYFLSSLRRLKRKYKIDLIYIENISDNYIIIEKNTLFNNPILSESPTAFFLYNYVAYTLPSNQCLILY